MIAQLGQLHLNNLRLFVLSRKLLLGNLYLVVQFIIKAQLGPKVSVGRDGGEMLGGGGRGGLKEKKIKKIQYKEIAFALSMGPPRFCIQVGAPHRFWTLINKGTIKFD